MNAPPGKAEGGRSKSKNRKFKNDAHPMKMSANEFESQPIAHETAKLDKAIGFHKDPIVPAQWK
jgi:hypothetical protein